MKVENSTVLPSDDFEYYQSHIFYTNFKIFSDRENTKISGSTDINWTQYVKQKYHSFGSALVFNCGNGWVERDFFQRGLIQRVVGFDILPKYVSEAREQADAIGLPCEYFEANGNLFVPNGLRCDVAVNSGAMHHVAYINRLTAILAEIVEDGLYVAHDYTGAHRNQYSLELWHKILKVHEAMPARYRITLGYPHMPTMLATDPSEAIHAELQMETVQRHFDLEEHVRLGGGVAHTLLLNNHVLHRDQHTEEGRAVLEMILQADEEALHDIVDGNLFTFLVARPKTPKPSAEQMQAWQAEEDERESGVAARGGRYYDATPLELIYNDFTWQRHYAEIKANARLQAAQTAATSEINAFRNSTCWQLTQPLRSLKKLLSARQG